MLSKNLLEDGPKHIVLLLITSRDENASIDGVFLTGLVLFTSASMILFRVTDGLAHSTTGTFNDEEAIVRKLFQRTKLGKRVKRSGRSVEIKGLCDRQIGEFRARNKRVLKLLCLKIYPVV